MPVEDISTFSNGPAKDYFQNDNNNKLQKINKLEQYLPYGDKVLDARETFLRQLKLNLAEAVIAQGDCLINWINSFNL